MLRSVTGRLLLLVAVALVVASATALTLLSSGGVIPSVVRNPLSDFVQPGITVWWFVLGGPFRVAPSSAGGIAFAAVANAVLWLGAIWIVVALYRLVHRRLTAFR
jgi:hypothetical protein